MGMNNVIELPLTYRANDPKTSQQAPGKAKRMTAMYRLLEVYCTNDVTDEEAVEMMLGRPATLADEGKRRRCSDLRALGWIAPTGDTRPNASGRQRIVCQITDAGRDAWMERQNG
jgi:hypothetical protein